MKCQCKFNQLLLMLGVLLLFGMSAILPRSKTAQSLARRDPARPVQVVDQRENNEERELRPDHPDEALRFRRLQLKDEKGFIPPDGLEKARQHTKQMRVAPQGTIKPDTWSWLGPGNIGGRIRTIVFDPANASNIWLGSVGGGIWRSVDDGTSWGTFTDFIANLAVSTMAVNPINSDLYAGTGEIFAASFNNPGTGFTPDGMQGAGIFKSTDNGLTWNQLPSTNPGNPPGIPQVCPTPAVPGNCPWLFVNRLAISPDGNTILAATGTNIQWSPDDGLTWFPAAGVAGQVLDVDFDPTNSQKAIAGLNGRVMFSVAGGQFWFPASFKINATDPNPTVISGRVEVAYAPSNPAIVYASVDQNNGDIFRSTDGGQTFVRVNTGTNFFLSGGTPPSSQGNYDNVIWVNPQDPSFVIVGGIDLWRSTNNGMTFTQISRWQSSPVTSAHADHHVIVAHPGFNNTTNRIVYFGNDGGIYRTNDVQTVTQTSGWQNQNRLLGITQFYGGAGNPTTGRIIGGAQDNGTVSYPVPGLYQWGIVTDTDGGGLGDGGYCAADPTDPNYFYGEYIYLTIYRSTNDAISVTDIFSGITDAGSMATANFIAPFILDPSNPDTMLAGGVSLWRSTNVKDPIPTWTPIKQPVTQPPPPNVTDGRISAIAISPVSSNLIVVGHNNGDIYRTVTGTFLPPPNDGKIDTAALPNRFVTRLVIDYTRATNWIYATFGGFSADNIYRTTDNGATWTDITGGPTIGGKTIGLPDVPVRTLVYHPRNPNLLYVGTEVGIFTSDDAGATWEVPQNGPANVSVDELFWMGEDLIAVTHGRGMYRASGGIYVDCNYNGKNGTENGTFDRPFKTISAALNAAPSYRTIWLKPCTYTEPAVINQRVELRSLGGRATIRKP
jgi:photosystem II stability/assembly factor-like uncharacterized protein